MVCVIEKNKHVEVKTGRCLNLRCTIHNVSSQRNGLTSQGQFFQHNIRKRTHTANISEDLLSDIVRNAWLTVGLPTTVLIFITLIPPHEQDPR